MSREFEIGIQLHLPTFRHLSLRDFVDFARDAHAGGVSQIWVTDNLRSRNQFVVLTAIASSVPVKLGTAVTVYYFRNPVDLADSVAAITDLMDGREFGLGLARGNRNTPKYVRVTKPVSMLRETAQSVRRLLAGEEVKFADYPTIASYFNLMPEAAYRMNFLPRSPVLLYCGGNGPKALAVGGACMDGVIFGGTFQAVVRMGRMPELLQAVRQGADAAGRGGAMRRVAEIKLSVASDGRAAREFTRHSVAGRIVSLRESGYNADYAKLGIDPADVDQLQAAEKSGRPIHDYLDLVTDAMVDGIFVAGDPAHCREKMAGVCDMARTHGYQQLMFSELGPDLKQGLRLLCDEILPHL